MLSDVIIRSQAFEGKELRIKPTSDAPFMHVKYLFILPDR